MNTRAISVPVAQQPKISRQIPVALPAATIQNGQVTPAEISLTQAGSFFYVIACSVPVSIQAVRAGAIGATNVFGAGQGQPVSDGFDTLAIKNYQLIPAVALIWVGYDAIINNQLLLVSSSYQNIVNPVYNVPNSAGRVDIDDISGRFFTDLSGKKWGALQRVAIEVFNLDTGTTMLLQKKGATTAVGPAVGAIFPATPIRFDFGGDYCITLGGAVINAIVNEIYSAFPA